MPGEGHILAMIQSLRYNRSLLRRKGMYPREKQFLNLKKESLRARNGTIESKKVSKEVLLRIRKKMAKQRKKENLLLVCIALVLVSIVMFYGFKFVAHQSSTVDTFQLEKETEKNNQYLFYIVDGDAWFSKRKWHNAVFQYKKALALYPGDYDAMFRLTRAMSYHCQEKGKDCAAGKKYYDQLKGFNPNDSQLVGLKERFQ
tara:strand:+ start:19041 stop:19643 length:603 start_codon:yes stop_codon:yes gene_type:complete